MRRDVAGRVALAIFAVCLAGLLFLCLEGQTLRRLNAEVRHGRRNESLYLEKLGEGSFFIGGTGMLYGADMLALVEGEGDRSDVTDIVIGDGITDLGYGALNGYEKLNTLWLGRDMKRAEDGALKDCPALRYVFLPSGFEKCGRDFLYNCGKCYVVTDGGKKALPKLWNTKSKRVLSKVDSYEALADARGQKKLPEGLKRWWS